MTHVYIFPDPRSARRALRAVQAKDDEPELWSIGPAEYGVNKHAAALNFRGEKSDNACRAWVEWLEERGLVIRDRTMRTMSARRSFRSGRPYR